MSALCTSDSVKAFYLRERLAVKVHEQFVT